jgi:dolichol-phosphate mannosyltransferase
MKDVQAMQLSRSGVEVQNNKATDTGKNPELTVLVPVHNEEQNISPLIQEIKAALDFLPDYEIVYVDDGSTDNTFGVLLQEADKCSILRVIRHQQNCGQSTALCSGVREARAEKIVTLDGDGQNDPADIPRLWQQMSNSDSSDNLLVCGYRRHRHDSLLKRASSRIANRFRQYLLKDETPDTGCGIKMFSRTTFLELPYFDHMHRFLPALFLRNGGRVLSVTVNHRPRTRGRSHYGMFNRLWIGLFDTFGVAWLQRRIKYPTIVKEQNK